MKLTTEAILCHPQAFGLPASPAQRAVCRISDGLPLGELANDPSVQRLLGGPAAVLALPNERPAELHLVLAIRTFKSLFAAAKIFQWSQSVDVSGLAVGDLVRIGVTALKIDATRAVMSHVVENGRTRPLLKSLFVGEPTLAGAVLRHPTDRPIEVTPSPLDRAGGSIQSTWAAGWVFDEEPRMIGADDGVKNWTHARDGVPGRLLNGGQLLGIGAPHAPFGPVFNLVTEHFGKPTRDLVILRGTGPDLNPSWWTPERCADLERRNPVAYRTDVLGEFADAESSWVVASELDAVTRSTPSELLPEKGKFYFGAIDPSGKTNAFTLLLGTVDGTGEARRVRVVLARQWLPKSGLRTPEEILSAIATVCRPYGVRTLASDQFAFDAMKSLARHVGLHLEEYPTTAASKLAMFEDLRVAIVGGHFEICPDPVVRADLLSVRKRVTQTGAAIHLPSTSDGRHADYAPAIALLHHIAPSGDGRLYVPSPVEGGSIYRFADMGRSFW